MSKKVKDVSVRLSHAIKILNEALVADRKTVSRLFASSFYHNSTELAEHPTIQCGQGNESFPWRLRPIGVINGIFGTNDDSCGFIAMELEDDLVTIRRFVLFDGAEFEEESINEGDASTVPHNRP